ncbi:Mating-type protein beta1-1 [Termitomyces sp. T112]|nr:Mating-type protein beta1-1 [Termitomyces sp. T112]
MPSDIDNQFLLRISALEDEIIQNPRTCADDASCEVFNLRWVTLVDDLKAAMDAELLSSSTITTAHALADRVTFMVQTFWELNVLSQKLMVSLLDETATFPHSPDISHDTASKTTITQSLPLYIRSSYHWLLDNIHNPYPPAYIRDVIAQKSGATRKDVDHWFIDIRKRIGWNDARKAHFSNKRADMVDAATRFYTNDQNLSLSLDAEYALVSIMKNAKDIYRDKLNESDLATKLDTAVKDLTPEIRAKAECLRQVRLKKARDVYPSPDQSPEPSHLSPVPCNDEVDTVQPKSISSRKRKNLSAEAELDETGESTQAKRSRLETLDTSSKNATLSTDLPSPASSVDEFIDPPSTPTLLSHKRRSSETGGDQVTFKRRHLPAGGRPQIVSGSLPLSNNLLFDETSFDGWFQQILNPPEVGEIGPSDFSVELGNLSDFNCETSAEPCSISPEFSEQTSEPPTLEVSDIPTVLDEPWNEFDFGCIDNPSLSSNHIGQSKSLVNLVEQVKPLAQDLVNFQASSQISRPVNEFESFFDFSNPSLLVPVVIPPNLTSDETWNFSDSTVNRDANVSGKQNADLSSNGLFASFDFSQREDFLPSRSNANSLSAFPQGKARQEKEKEFRETYEKAQRLALELQRDDLLAL